MCERGSSGAIVPPERPEIGTEESVSEGFSRRAVVCGGCAWVATGCVPPPASEGIDPPPTADTAGAVAPGATTPAPDAAYPCGQSVPAGPDRIALSLVEHPELAEVGGWIAVASGGGEIVVAHVRDGCYVAMDRACSHEGVPVDYRPEREQFTCPRHGAVYDLQGGKVAGPQPTGLPVYAAAREQDTIRIDPSAPVTP